MSTSKPGTPQDRNGDKSRKKRNSDSTAERDLPQSDISKEEAQRLGNAIYDAIGSFVTSLVRRRSSMTVLQTEIEDIIQEVFTRFQHALLRGGFPDLTTTKSLSEADVIRLRQWLSRTARYVMFEFHRKAALRAFSNYDGLEMEAVTNVASTISMFDIERAIDECPEDQRAVIELKLTGRSTAEIASTLSMSEASVRARLRRARDRLEEILGPVY